MVTRETIQKEALNELLHHDRATAAISMGVGKTLIALKHMKAEGPGKKFLVVAPKLSIFKTWKEEAELHGYSELLEQIKFTTYISLDKQDPGKYDIVYLDECHFLKYSHESFLNVFLGKIIGLTGTPPKHKSSEKGEMIRKYCPVVYSYITDDAVNDKILNDYIIYVHRIPLDSRKNVKITTKSGGFFMDSEENIYNYWSKKIAQTFNTKEQMRLRLKRMQAMQTFPSKERYAKNLLKMIDQKCIVFCNTTEQADQMCDYTYHSKNPYSERNLQMFNDGSINELACVQQLNEGVNAKIKQGIILHMYNASSPKAKQRFGRLLRLNPDETCILHILCYEDTVDEKWTEANLADLNEDKIFYY